MPENLKEIMLLQPKTITFGSFSITPVQENILTLIIEQLQKYMTNDIKIWTDLYGLPVILIDCNEAGSLRHKNEVLKAAKDILNNKCFRYTWVNPRNGKTYTKYGTILCNVDDEHGSHRIILTLNPWAIPYLLYYGKGAGGGYFEKSIALNLKSEYSKRLYKIICTECDRREYYYSIDKFREDLLIPSTYSNAQIKQKILDKAVKEIKKSGSYVWFDYDFITRKEENKSINSGHKDKADTIVFHITNVNALGGTSQKERNEYVYQWLLDTFAPSGADGLRLAHEAEVLLMKSPLLDTFFKRLRFWERKLNNYEMTTSHVYNCIKQFLREDLKFDC